MNRIHDLPAIAFVIAISILSINVANAQEFAPLEAYGRLPTVDLMALSPQGKSFAARVTSDGRDLVVVFDMESGEFVTGANAAEVNPRWLRFVDERYLILVAGRTVRSFNVRHAFDYSSAYAFDVETTDIKVLMRNARDLYPYQSGLGRIIGRDSATNTIFMPAYTGESYPVGGIYAATMGARRERLVAKGTADTIDWFLDADGRPLVREDFDDDENVHQIWLLDEKGRKDRILYELETEIPVLSVLGITPERDALVVLMSSRWAGGTSYFLMSIEDGSITGPILTRENAEIGALITDINRVVYGVEYSGFKPTYALFDKDLNDRIAAIQRRLSGMSARLVSWDDNFNKLLFQVEGGITAGVYLLFDKDSLEPKSLGRSRPNIEAEHVVPVEITEYEARDGLTIPALVTVRDDVRGRGSGPLIVMPHGGPQAHDAFGFDWMAQYFASRGYIVLQPQFRGSDGFGYDHVMAGEGEWGGKMQTDLDDGVTFLVEQGLADPSRVCMVGASYGGYAALAAGAFSPGMYKCVAAIAPVTDLPRKIRTARSRRGSDDWTLDYWEGLYGAEVSEKEILRSISPVFHARAFEAPVLLLHGEKDTIVDIDQSKAMDKALRKAKKDVTFIRLKGEDHWLTQEETRIETLRAVAAFIEKHL